MAFILIVAVIGLLLKEYNLVVYSIYLMSFTLGEFVSKYNRLRSFIMKDIVFGLSALFFCMVVKIYPMESTSMIVSLFNLILYAVTSVMGSIFFYNLFRRLTMPNWLQWYFRETGKSSLAIYMIPLLMIPPELVIPESYPNSTVIILLIIVSVAHALVSTVLHKIILQVPIVRFLMFGKK